MSPTASGVYLKANEECVKAHGVPPPEHDPGTRFVERQLAAVPANPGETRCIVPASKLWFGPVPWWLVLLGQGRVQKKSSKHCVINGV